MHATDLNDGRFMLEKYDILKKKEKKRKTRVGNK